MKVILKMLLIILGILIPLQSAIGFEMRGFMDITYQQSSSDKASEPLKNGAFLLGGLDYFVAHDISDKLDVLSEIVFEAPAGDMILDLERIEIGYSFGDLLNLRAGRFHTPLGYYANVYHHGRHMDSTISRPLILEFEDAGGLVPAHIVGIWARGNMITGSGTIKYSLGVANGQKIDVDNKELKINMTSDDNKDKVKFGGITFEPKFLDGFGIGASAYSGKINGYTDAGGAVPTIDLDQLITGVNLYYDTMPVQFIAEYYSVKSDDVKATPSKSYTSTGYFIQAAYEIQEKFRPYLRYEEVKPEKGDTYATSLIGDDKINNLTYGIGYNISPESSLRLEGNSKTTSKSTGDENVQIIGAQWTFMF
jgi:hypothetical protein